MSKYKEFTFDEICDSQEFDHDHLFVEKWVIMDLREQVRTLYLAMDKVRQPGISYEQDVVNYQVIQAALELVNEMQGKK